MINTELKSEEQILVTICCTAFNQEKFIRQCLEGFVMQKTTFRFEAIVHDDASTDNTATIIKEYAAKYPHIIKPIFETENQYSKHNGSLRRIMRANMRGKYIANCEADDYWIDPYKLQKQIDILESDPQVTMVYTSFKTVDSECNPMLRPTYEKYKKISSSGYILNKLLSSGNFIMTLTTCIRKEVYESDIMKNSNIGLDYLLFLTAASMGKVVFIPEETGCYRYSPTSEMNANLGYVQKSYIKSKKYFVKSFLDTEIENYSFRKKICLYTNLLENALTFYSKKIDKEYLHIILSKKESILFLPIGIFSFFLTRIKKRCSKFTSKYENR